MSEDKIFLNEEELESVQGGNYKEAMFCSVKLHEMGAMDHTVGMDGNSEVKEVFAKYGVEVVCDLLKPNEYYIDGKKVGFQDALQHVKDNLHQ